MKILAKVIGALLLCVVILLGALRITGLEPHEQRPGLWLKGEVATVPVTDWSFTNNIQTIKVETRTWYGIPHSVTTNCASYMGRLYLLSFYRQGGVFPRDKVWTRDVVRDPHVRMKIGNQIYERTLSVDNDPGLKETLLQIMRKKYPDLAIPTNDRIYVFDVS